NAERVSALAHETGVRAFALSSGSAAGRRFAPAFVFQSDDAVRRVHVTGVQTCALRFCAALARVGAGSEFTVAAPGAVPSVSAGRSEERRVGKEWRARVAPEYEINNASTCGVRRISNIGP